MDDDDFEDLLAGVDWFLGSSQESLTFAAADLAVHTPITTPTSVHSQEEARLPITDGANLQIQHEPRRLPGDIMSLGSTLEQLATPLIVSEKIEHIFLDLSDALSTGHGQLRLVLRAKPSTAGEQTRIRYINFPGKTAEEAWRFSESIRLRIDRAAC